MTITRRKVLAGAAAVAVSTPVSTRAGGLPDRKTLAEYLAAWESADWTLGEIDVLTEPQPSEEWNAALKIEEMAFAAVLAYPVRTMAELDAKAAFLRRQIDREGRDLDGDALAVLMRSCRSCTAT